LIRTAVAPRSAWAAGLLDRTRSSWQSVLCNWLGQESAGCGPAHVPVQQFQPAELSDPIVFTAGGSAGTGVPKTGGIDSMRR
jgi:hypothetical protein